MLNEDTGILEIPYNIASLSRATGNPMLDLGYQCCDMRPYFKYTSDTNTIYTNVHPNNIISQTINVYEKYNKNIDGRSYASMRYIGNTTSASLDSITYEDVVYTYSNSHENIRGFYINKWARYKPIQHNKIDELNRFIDGKDTDDFINNDCGITLLEIPIPTSGGPMNEKEGLILNMLNDLKAGNFFWTYNPPKEGNWFRMTDFIGYNRKAKNPFYMEYVGGIGPTYNDIRDIYIDTKDDTHEVKITLGEEKEMFLPENNITTKCLPNYFKQLHALGLVYEGTNGVGVGFIDPYDTEDKTSEGFLYPLRTGKSVDIPLTIRIGATYSIGAFLINKDSGDTGYYFPVKPLNLRFLRIPDVVKVDYDYYVDRTKDLVIRVNITRNGSTWWWGVHRPDDYVYGIRTVTNNPSYTDHPLTCWAKKDSEAEHRNVGNDNIAERELVKDGITYEWNGYSEPNTQLGIDNPVFEVPHLYGVDSLTIYLRFVELKDVVYPVRNSIDDIYIQGNLLIDVQGSNYTTQTIEIGREVFEEVGWLDPINTENN